MTPEIKQPFEILTKNIDKELNIDLKNQKHGEAHLISDKIALVITYSEIDAIIRKVGLSESIINAKVEKTKSTPSGYYNH